MEKKKRLRILKRILGKNSISDQESLIKYLKKENINVSQSSLSRDLQELGTQRIRKGRKLVYILPDESPAAHSDEIFNKRFANSVISIKRVEFIIIILTPPGEASLVARLLDTSDISELSGSVAGDDTIICIANNKKNAMKLEKKLKELIK